MSDYFIDEEEFEDPSNFAYFEGPCTCDHSEEDHDWLQCAVEDCDCEAHWTY